MIHLHDAVRLLNPSVVTIRGDLAYDANDQEVEYDKEAAETKFVELKTEQEQAKQIALNKLMALGLTEEEALALGVK